MGITGNECLRISQSERGFYPLQRHDIQLIIFNTKIVLIMCITIKDILSILNTPPDTCPHGALTLLWVIIVLFGRNRLPIRKKIKIKTIYFFGNFNLSRASIFFQKRYNQVLSINLKTSFDSFRPQESLWARRGSVVSSLIPLVSGHQQ